MSTQLFIITGSSGTGKTTVLPFLKKKLPNNFKAYDWDELLRPYDDSGEVWALDVTKKMFQIATSNAVDNTNTVILGLVRPGWIKKLQPKFSFDHIKFCLLDVSVEERTKRLKKRNSPQYLIDDLEEQEGFPLWMRESGFPFAVIDTSNLSVKNVTEKIVDWIKTS